MKKTVLFVAAMILSFSNIALANVPLGTSFAYPVPNPSDLVVYNIGYFSGTSGNCPNQGGAIYTQSVISKTTATDAPSWAHQVTWNLGVNLYRECLDATISAIHNSAVAPPQSDQPATVFYDAGFNFMTATPATWINQGFFDPAFGRWFYYGGAKLSLDGQNLLVCFSTEKGSTSACW